jgi:hypothetical protein
LAVPAPGGGASTSQGHPRTIFRRALERGNLVLAEVTAREIGRVTIAEALELTALVARKQPHRYGRFAARWLCLWLEEHEHATLDTARLNSEAAGLLPFCTRGSRRSSSFGFLPAPGRAFQAVTPARAGTSSFSSSISHRENVRAR